jgi:DNA adenine methylase
MGSSSAALHQVPGPAPSEPARPRPFLKWVGGKGRLIEQLRPHLPSPFKRYFEPFAGGAALFFALGPPRASLSDVNAELIDCYRTVRDKVEDVIVALGQHRYTREHYYRVRAIEPSTLKLPERAARTIYLNKTGYNGLYRVNRAGKFNVPMGRYTNPTVCDAENLRACSAALQRVELQKRDFAEEASRARAGDFVYFDPPYDPRSPTSAFTSYAAGGFGPEAQRRLAGLFAGLARKGVHVVLSNSDTPLVRELYRPFRIAPVLAARSINSRGSRRGKVGEVVVTSFG